MNPMSKKTTTGTVAALMALMFGAMTLTGGEAQAQQNGDPDCSTITYYPGAVTVLGKARGTAEEGDFRSCSTTYQCGSNARKIEVFGYGYASHAGGVIANENFAVAADGTEAILASCESTNQHPQGLGNIRSCLAEPQQFTSQTAVAEQADCTVVVGAPAGEWTVASSTCFCED